MQPADRRSFLKLLGSGAFAATMQQSIGRALAIPANNRTGTINDVEHIVVLMQENRSFDHYFGTLQGVRGFDDPRAVTLPSGKPVWYQPFGAGYVLPFHPTAPDLGMQFLQDLPHDWETTHLAWNQGNWDQWVPNKGTTTMAHLDRNDIPFHYALADAFTICDAYHCSLLGPTDPNRYYMWTGWVGNDGKNGGPVIDNAEAGYDWSTYPERLQAAGIGWKIYQDIGTGLTAGGGWGWGENAYIGNYGDNSLLYFHQYQNAAVGSPLAVGAKTGTDIAVSGTMFDEFRSDVSKGKLPPVSWIVAPEAYTEHPNWPANYGAWYVSQMLDILTANPDVWSKTVFLITYDENDGFFDHMVPPTPPQTKAHGQSTVSIVNEIYAGGTDAMAGPYGLGARVPMIVVSPWSKGGWVNSQLFDHTSIIRFIEQRFGPHNPALVEPNITPWRRAVAGDLTSAFDFRSPNRTIAPLSSTTSFKPVDALRHPDYVPLPPVVQALPAQERGIRRARALPYRSSVHGHADMKAGSFSIAFGNDGSVGTVYQVRSTNPLDVPRSYTVEPKVKLEDSWLAATAGAYDLSVYGPNGFLRTFRGAVASFANADVVVDADEDEGNCGVVVNLRNRGRFSVRVHVLNAYSGHIDRHTLTPGEKHQIKLESSSLFGWYDLTVTVEEDAVFRCQLAGHVETGRDSVTDPAIGVSS
ncbi:phospholipase C, phosphocholine-specific [Lichenicola cladoniae]|uniref:phospholipase C n=1 Tax=Lichenicola cladoniae TaxID=1484109 RepID=A0A6M8HNP0_9PROT|nr:phospholipase C, phosphocholine-specific [Lichenicola cladoniae]NPD67430.1 phospholipase C, phosphocholine-specific [Acetobacteraceae bacterium]QKE89920.1 phospholipase C, phosphocholine-specific [Lichenicola cladoniae]